MNISTHTHFVNVAKKLNLIKGNKMDHDALDELGRLTWPVVIISFIITSILHIPLSIFYLIKQNKLASIIVLCLALRMFWILSCDYRPPFTFEEAGIKNYSLTEYDVINIDAARIANGIWPRGEDITYEINDGYKVTTLGKPLAWRPIGYPAFLGLLYFLFGASYSTLYGSTLLLSTLTTLLVYAIGKEVFDEDVGLLSAFLFSIYPVAIYSTTLSLDEHLFLPLFYGGICLLLREI